MGRKCLRRGGRANGLFDCKTIRLFGCRWNGSKPMGVHEELEAVRAQHDGRLPSYSAPLVENFLSEAEGDVGGWLKELDVVDCRRCTQPSVATGLDAELRSYQFVGYCWLSWLENKGLVGCLPTIWGLVRWPRQSRFFSTSIKPRRPIACGCADVGSMPGRRKPIGSRLSSMCMFITEAAARRKSRMTLMWS